MSHSQQQPPPQAAKLWATARSGSDTFGQSSERVAGASGTVSQRRGRKLNVPRSKLIASAIGLVLLCAAAAYLIQPVECQQPQGQFPGVSRELSSFCASRPSLPVDLASMVVHVKRNTSFNYKLYLFSTDHIFQTGQVIPRADFRIHSFPVKLKHINEFWPQQSIATYKFESSDVSSRRLVESNSFNLRQFLRRVPLNPFAVKSEKRMRLKPMMNGKSHTQTSPQMSAANSARQASDAEHWDALPGDDSHSTSELNRHIRFDRDDQVSSMQLHRLTPISHTYANSSDPLVSEFVGDSIIPVASFSSFHVNSTYLVRKDFDQSEPEIIQIQLDAQNFAVTQVQLISDGQQNSTTYPQNEDYNFLTHKILRDPNTRITAINQIYEDWITRNFYTIVYVQRKTSESGERDNKRDEASGRAMGIVNDRLVFRGSSLALLGADQLDYSVNAAAFITEKNGLHYYLEFLATLNKFQVCAVDWSRRPFKMIDSRQFPIKATRSQLDNEELLLCPPAICYSNQPIDEIISYGRLPFNVDQQNLALHLRSTSGGGGGGSGANDASPLLSNANRAKQQSNQPTDGAKLEFLADLLLPSGGAVDETGSHQPAATATSTSSKADGPTASPTMAPIPTLIALGNGGGGGGSGDTDASSKPNYRDTLSGTLKLSATQLETKLHLRDWTWTLTQRSLHHQTTTANQSATSTNHRRFQPTSGANANEQTISGGGKFIELPVSFHWRYELARRNDIKVKPDTYGYVLTGHEIDASYRVYNELYLISANHLITINYTLANETVTSSHPIDEEFPGLSSTLIDPITGAYYDRFTNQIYFFKGDRYVGYDYATKKPLDDFQLQAPGSFSSPSGGAGESELNSNQPLVTSLPVVGILGRQHHVDGIYHDYLHDLVFVFTGMKFYFFEAHKFKDGIFKVSEADGLPKMRCINTHFLSGCQFDRAYPNPCLEDEESSVHTDTDTDNDEDDAKLLGGERAQNSIESDETNLPANELAEGQAVSRTQLIRRRNFTEIITPSLKKDSAFTEEQQMKLRTIASRGGSLNATLLDDNSIHYGLAKIIDSNNADLSLIDAPAQSRSQEAVIIYLLIAMVGLTLVVTVAMIAVLFNWSRGNKSTGNGLSQSSLDLYPPNDIFNGLIPNNHTPQTRSTPPNQLYLADQHHYYSRRQLPSPRTRPPRVPSPPRAHRRNYPNADTSAYTQHQYITPQITRHQNKLHAQHPSLVLAGRGSRLANDVDSSAL